MRGFYHENFMPKKSVGDIRYLLPILRRLDLVKDTLRNLATGSLVSKTTGELSAHFCLSRTSKNG